METISPEVKKAFGGLVCRLSPENLCADGELSRTEVNRRHRQIVVEWKALETRIGRTVSEDEVYQWKNEEWEKTRRG